MPMIKCKRCGKEVFRQKEKVLPTGNYCSNKCLQTGITTKFKRGYTNCSPETIEKIKLARMRPRGANFSALYNTYKFRAEERGLKFLISRELFGKMTKDNCHYCGAEPSAIHPSSKYIYNGIDRYDNDKGYMEGNIVTCCKGCNYGKRQMTIEQFVAWIEQVKKHFIDSGKVYSRVFI